MRLALSRRTPMLLGIDISHYAGTRDRRGLAGDGFGYAFYDEGLSGGHG